MAVAGPVTGDRPASRPVLRVVRGRATPEELAAVVAVLLAGSGAGAASPAPARPVRSAWSDRSRQLRRPLHPGRGAWRRSALPG
jgi:Acyl-CoA carboxylase epsilon subunit